MIRGSGLSPRSSLSLYDLLAEARAVVTYFSTVGVEAAFTGFL